MKSKIKKRKLFKSKNLHLIAPSKWIKYKAFGSKNFKTDNIHQIYNGVDNKIFYKEDQSTKCDFGIDDNLFVIGICSSNLIEKRKNVQITLDWLDDWCNKNKLHQQILVLIQGANFSRLKIKNPRFKEVKFFYTEMRKFYNCLDIFINLSISDNFPNTNLESVACGTPVILHKSGGSPELLVNQDFGFAVLTKIHFEKVLNHYFKNREKKLIHLPKQFQSQTMAKNYLKLYQSFY
jgi:glycosyltransferase involved in cell wall biosynthesis